jgi:S1-C subfamily serine protease
MSVNAVYRKAQNAVVEIHANTTSQLGQQGEAQGSGFVFDRQGHILTNDHVVSDASSVRVQFANGASYSATVVGTDPSTDLAVLDVDAPVDVLKPLPLGDSSALVVGDPVVAIGSPFGLEGTVTAGIVSALHRSMQAPNDFTINDSIQTDAAINHGNSGGPLLNLRGEVVGINAQIESDSGDNAGIGFAIPSNTIKGIANQLISSGKVQHAYLGVIVSPIPASVTGQLGEAAGLGIEKVVGGGAADKAGLQAATGSANAEGQSFPTGGDVITAFDGQKVLSAAELQSAVDAHRPGDKVRVAVTRDGKSRTVTVTLGTRPAQAAS